MTVLFFYPESSGGVKNYCKELSNYLEAKGFNCKTISYKFTDSLVVKKKIVDNKTIIYLSKYASLKYNTLYLTKNIEPSNLYLCNDSLELEALRRLNTKAPIDFVLHGDLEYYYNTIEKNISIISCVFAVSLGLVDKLQSIFPQKSVKLLYPLVRDPDVNKFKGDLSSPLKVYFSGRFELAKGADTYIQVVHLASSKRLPIQWSVFIPKKGNDEKLLSKLPNKVNVIRGASHEEMLDRFNEADILIFPSRTEGFGLAVLEAQKRGVAVIARNIPIGIPDMIIEGISGLYASDQEEIVAILEHWNGHRQELKSLQEATQKFALEKFAFQFIASRAQNLISQFSDPGTLKRLKKNSSFSATLLMPLEVLKRLIRKIKYG